MIVQIVVYQKSHWIFLYPLKDHNISFRKAILPSNHYLRLIVTQHRCQFTDVLEGMVAIVFLTVSIH